MEKNINNSEQIDDILNIVSEMPVANKDSNLVYEVDDDNPGLVFELSDREEDCEEPAVEFEYKKPQIKVVKEESKEFFVPEEIKFEDKVNITFKEDEKPTVYTTYVPRFTGVGDNYRMAQSSSVHQTEEQLTSSVDNVRIVDEGEILDHTAEIYDKDNSENPPRPIKPLAKQSEEIDSVSKVFKFSDEEDDNENKSEEAFLPTEAAFTEVIPTEDDFPPVKDIVDEPDVEEKEKFYVIPDPVFNVDSKENLPANVMFSTALVDAPVGVGEKLEISRKNEYNVYSQRDGFKDNFLDSIMSIKVRLIAAAILSLIVLVIETLFAFGVDIPVKVGIATLPGAMAIIDVQFIICLFFTAIPEVIRSVKNLVARSVTPELFITVAFITSLIYTAIIITVSPHKYMLCGAMFAILIIGSIIASYAKSNADFISFKVASVNGEKCVVDNKMTRTLPYENAALDGCIKEHASRTARFFRTVFVADFFKKISKVGENSKNTLIVIAASLSSALIAALCTFFLLDGIVSAASTFTLVVFLSMPTASVLIRKVPFYYSMDKACVNKTTVIGESAMADYSKIDVITFEDTEMFGPDDVNLKRIMLYGNSNNLTKALRQMSALFMNVGGPLDNLFSKSLDRKCTPASNVKISDNGISGEIDGHSVFAGTSEYMASLGVKIPQSDGSDTNTAIESTRVMYAAEDGTVYAKFYIRYSFSEDFSMILPLLEDAGIIPLVYTCDPNITDELIKLLTTGMDKIRVMKQKNAEAKNKQVYRKISASMVTNAGKHEAIQTILLAKKYEKLQSKLSIFETSAMIIGAVLSVIISVCGAFLLPSFIYALWQTALCLAVFLVGKKCFDFR